MTDDTFSSDAGSATDGSFVDNDSYLEGENVDKLRKSHRHAQDHIKTLEKETADMRSEIEKLRNELAGAKTVDELYQRIVDQDSERYTTDAETTPPQVDELVKQIKEEILGDLTQDERARKERENWDRTNQLLSDKYGEKYSNFVDERAEELGMTVAQMRDLARTSPEAVVALVSKEAPKSPSPTASSISTGTVSRDSGSVNAEYFTKVRKENPKLWHSMDFQKQYWQYLKENVVSKQ